MIPKFVTDDIRKIPRVPPEEQNLLTLIDRMAQMEEKMTLMESRVNRNSKDVSANKEKVTTLETHYARASYAVISRSGNNQQLQEGTGTLPAGNYLATNEVKQKVHATTSLSRPRGAVGTIIKLNKSVVHSNEHHECQVCPVINTSA